MKFKVTNNENVSTVFLNGEIDMDIADDVREIVFPLIDSGKEVHLNLKDVQYPARVTLLYPKNHFRLVILERFCLF